MQLRNGNNNSRTVSKRIVPARTNMALNEDKQYTNAENAGGCSLSPSTILGLIINRENMTVPFKNWKGQQ